MSEESSSQEAVEPAGSLQLVGSQRLLVERHEGGDLIRLVGRDGRLTLSIEVTERGPVLRFDGADLAIQSTGALAIDAEQVTIRGRDSVAFLTDGDVEILAAGELNSEARRQNITATRGDISVRANDDVKIDGERIRMNC